MNLTRRTLQVLIFVTVSFIGTSLGRNVIRRQVSFGKEKSVNILDFLGRLFGKPVPHDVGHIGQTSNTRVNFLNNKPGVETEERNCFFVACHRKAGQAGDLRGGFHTFGAEEKSQVDFPLLNMFGINIDPIQSNKGVAVNPFSGKVNAGDSLKLPLGIEIKKQNHVSFPGINYWRKLGNGK